MGIARGANCNCELATSCQLALLRAAAWKVELFNQADCGPARTLQVIKHEDVWHNVPTPRLPLLWRRLNAGCTNMLFRWLGWNRELQKGRVEAGGLSREE